MTTPSDRDRSEGPWWPPAAAAAAYLDEPVPFVLSDEPVGAPWPLEEGDTGVPLLPSAPAGVTVRCAACPESLADTRGGVLVHHADGSHTYEPPEPRGLPEYLDEKNAELVALRAEGEKWRAAALTMDAERLSLRARLADSEQEVRRQYHEAQTAEAQVARVEALVVDYERARPSNPKWDSIARNIRAALDGA